jgi:hypothetical protein
MAFKTKMKRLFREIKLLVYYCSPCLLSLAIVIGANFQRVRDVQGAVVRQVCQQLDHRTDATEPGIVVAPQLQKIINIVKANGWTNCNQNTSSVSINLTVPQYIQSHFLTAWSVNSVVIAVLTLLPFAILGAGLVLKYHSHHGPSKATEELVKPEKKQNYLNYRAIALRDFSLKFLVAFVIAVGWLYIFNPHGQAASAINDWLRRTDIISSDTTPNFSISKTLP